MSMQKRFMETTESKINMAHNTNRLRRERYGAPRDEEKRKAALAKKGIYQDTKPTKNKFVLKAGTSLEKANEESAKLNPKGTVKPHRVSEADKKLMERIHECAQQPGRAEEAFTSYHMLKIRPATYVYQDLLQVCLINSQQQPAQQPEQSAVGTSFLGEALQLYQDIKYHGVQPNVQIFTTLAQICRLSRHVPRAMYVYKEMLKKLRVPEQSSSLWPKRREAYSQFYVELFSTLYESNAPSRAAAVYDIMYKEHQHLISAMSGEEVKRGAEFAHAPRRASAAFVRSFIKDEKAAELFAFKIRQCQEGNVPTDSIEAAAAAPEDKDYESMPIEQLLNEMSAGFGGFAGAQFNAAAHSLSSESAFGDEVMQSPLVRLIGGTDNLNTSTFQITSELSRGDFADEQITKHALNNIHKMARLQFNAIVDGDVPDSVETLPGMDGRLADMLLNDALEEKAQKILAGSSIDDILTAEAEYKLKKQEIAGKASTKLNWRPVIIGIDGTPFFPKSIDISNVNGEAVRRAKQEYLESIEDPEARQDIEETFLDRIKLCWFDVDRSQIVSGLFH